MKTIIKLDVPEYQIGQEVSIYFKDTMMIKGVVEKETECEDAINRILKRMWNCRGKHTTSIDKVKMEQIIRDELSSVKPQEPFMNKPCVAHQICHEDKVKILDKIRAEIEQTAKDYDKFADYRRVRGLWIALEIIEKYKAESEG